MSKWEKKPVRLNHPAEATGVPIVSDAAIATVPVGDGRMIPLVIIDTSGRPDIDDLVLAHKHMDGQGDVRTRWGRPNAFFDTDVVSLILMFDKPSHCVIVLTFELGRYGGFVDQIVLSQGLYIQPGRPGDRLRTTFYNARILAEVPSREFQSEWDKMLRKATRKRFQRDGMSRAEAKLATESMIREWRDLWSKRIKGPLEDSEG
jgi:hypothetical protein